jgi:prolyl-tRNA synthetase
MLMSKLLMPTMRQMPSDAQIISHQLMLKAGLIRKVASGIYTYLPLGLKVIKKLSAIVESEMNKAGAQELLMPMVQPCELWEESGRFTKYGPELLRFKDRKETWFCLGPTHEEVITALVRENVQSYKNLPLNLYQIQTKFRDEIRPRFGLMRGREFIMKDAYSFCIDKASQDEIYQKMWQAYNNIFNRCGLKFRAVKADTGSIGGDLSHEFQVLANSGEDAIASCTTCNHAANVELAFIKEENSTYQLSNLNYKEVNTLNTKTIDSVCEYLNIPALKSIKSLALKLDGKLALVILRGDHNLSETKIKNLLKITNIEIAAEAEVQDLIGPCGFLGTINTKSSVRILADNYLKNSTEMVMGANKVDTHFLNIDVNRDIKAEFGDFREAQAKDLCINCGGVYEIVRGIEVGHIFYLGQKYSKAFNLTLQNESGQNTFLEMGCYGIGIGRTMAACIEQNHDEKGIIWPTALAPYQVSLLAMSNDEEIKDTCLKIYNTLQESGLEVLFDERDERAGVKFNDADLLGCPIRICLGKKSLANGEMEVFVRKSLDNGATNISLKSDYITTIKNLLK